MLELNYKYVINVWRWISLFDLFSKWNVVPPQNNYYFFGRDCVGGFDRNAFPKILKKKYFLIRYKNWYFFHFVKWDQKCKSCFFQTHLKTSFEANIEIEFSSSFESNRRVRFRNSVSNLLTDFQKKKKKNDSIRERKTSSNFDNQIWSKQDAH